MGASRQSKSEQEDSVTTVTKTSTSSIVPGLVHVGFDAVEVYLQSLCGNGLIDPLEPDKEMGVQVVIVNEAGKLINCLSLGNEQTAARFVKLAAEKAQRAAQDRASTRNMEPDGDLKGVAGAGGFWSGVGCFAVGVAGLPTQWDEALARVVAGVITATMEGETRSRSRPARER